MKIKFCKDCDNCRKTIRIDGNYGKFYCEKTKKEINPFKTVCKMGKS